MDLDQDAIRGDLARLAIENMDLKTELRATWTRPMADEQRRHHVLRRKLTELHVLLACARGKLHVVHPPREHEGAWDAAAWRDRVVARAGAAHAKRVEGVASEEAAP